MYYHFDGKRKKKQKKEKEKRKNDTDVLVFFLIFANTSCSNFGHMFLAREKNFSYSTLFF